MLFTNKLSNVEINLPYNIANLEDSVKILKGYFKTTGDFGFDTAAHFIEMAVQELKKSKNINEEKYGTKIG